jgi:spermidine/putrescine transport system ATP-binding protein
VQVPQDHLDGAPRELRIGVRPEKMRLVDAEQGGVNTLTGTVTDVSYIGVSTQYIVETKAGDELTVFAQNIGRGERHVTRGDQIGVVWDPEHTFVITDAREVPTLEEQV